uniref:NADH-ubiquinone oxidoreductase chain 3 n=1 Tax=Oreophryne sp. TNHC-GDC 18615 TaxID=1933078 RepID=A0A343VTF0_9NEOB|nr:NADH dehydrogenase subunit 3 [Oreophryne sp. TNHC-GDC 18615]
MLTYVLTATALSMALATISFWLPTTTPDWQKLSPYECGFDPDGSARQPYSLRFFLISILFLLFDLEIALLLPSPWAAQLVPPTLSLLWASVILIILTIGLMFEWTKGALEWAE